MVTRSSTISTAFFLSLFKLFLYYLLCQCLRYYGRGQSQFSLDSILDRHIRIFDYTDGLLLLHPWEYLKCIFWQFLFVLRRISVPLFDLTIIFFFYISFAFIVIAPDIWEIISFFTIGIPLDTHHWYHLLLLSLSSLSRVHVTGKRDTIIWKVDIFINIFAHLSEELINS